MNQNDWKEGDMEVIETKGNISHSIHYGSIDIPKSDINPYVIDESVLLFEPKLNDVVDQTTLRRSIFNNAVITPQEDVHLNKFYQYVYEGGGEDYNPEELKAMEPEFLRFLHSANFNYDDALELIVSNYKFRKSELLPATINGIETELNDGYMYWFGRDNKCRPTLFIDMFKLEHLEIDKIVKLVVFCFEFFLRYLNVGGRAENYNIIIDCYDKSVVQVPLQMMVRLSEIMSSKYRGRLHRMYFVNTPKLFNMMIKPLMSILPEATAQKIVILDSDHKSTFRELFNPNQLPEKYGGEQLNLDCNFYPFQFFPNAAKVVQDPPAEGYPFFITGAPSRSLDTIPQNISLVKGDDTVNDSDTLDVFSIPCHVLFGTCMVLDGHRSKFCGNFKLDMESWLSRLCEFMLTKEAGKYIISKRADLIDKVKIVQTHEQLVKFIKEIN